MTGSKQFNKYITFHHALANIDPDKNWHRSRSANRNREIKLISKMADEAPAMERKSSKNDERTKSGKRIFDAHTFCRFSDCNFVFLGKMLTFLMFLSN